MGKPGKKAGKGILPPTNPKRRTDPTKTSLRDQRTIKRLKMYTSKISRDEKGNIVKGSVLSASDRIDKQMARIAPDRRWFGNTRVIGQEALQEFRKEMGAKYRDPYSVILKQSKLPLSLLEEPKDEIDSIRQEMQWDKTFGDKASRKRVRLDSVNLEEVASTANAKQGVYEGGKKNKDKNLVKGVADHREDKSKNRILMKKGQSNRIWNELFKVVDSADVILYVVDARDPMGTRSPFLEEFLRKEKKYKHFVFVLNKCDLIPLWATARWLQVLSKDYPTIAFHASVNHPFGKGNLISLLRQFSTLHNVTHRGSKRSKTAISVGVVGYPNVGKSSIINTLRRKSVCKVAPIPGETKVWQYVALTRSIFLIDCPGVVYDRESNNDIQAVLKGVVRVERLGSADKSEVVHTVLQIVKKKDLTATYGILEWRDVNDFLEQLAKIRGKLISGGEPDVEAASRMVLYDWQRGKIPWFNAPSFDTNQQFRDAMTLPEDKQVKIIENYSTFNLVEDRLKRDVENPDDVHSDTESEEINSDAEEDSEMEDEKRPLSGPSEEDAKLSKGQDAPKRKKNRKALPGKQKVNPDATVATYLVEKEQAELKRKRQERRAAKLAAKQDPRAASSLEALSSSLHGDDDALWEQFVAAAQP